MKEIIEYIAPKYKLKNIVYQRDNLVFVEADQQLTIDVVTHLKEYHGFSHLVLISCVDWIEDHLFQLTYLLHNPEKKLDIGVKCYLDRGNPVMLSAHHLWKQVWTYQREIKEAYGIDFPGSPRVDENFVLEGWDEIPHMRRDFDTHEYAEKTFFPRPGRKSHDPATYMREKMYPNQPVTAKKNLYHE